MAPIYSQAARFTGEKSAGLAYVKVLGDSPPADLKEHLDTIFSLGERLALTADILGILLQRRANAIRTGPWVEGHYRPGRPLL